MNLLLDTHSLLYRAFHALPELTTSEGVPTGALYGFCSLLLKLLREQAPTSLAFALDTPGPTFRHERFEAYKGTRSRVPDALRAQRARLVPILAAIGAPRLSVEGFEADDVLATLARELTPPTRIVSGDRDLFQVARPGVDVLFVGRRQQEHVLYDVDQIHARYGLPPSSLPSLTALVGDPADNLAGIRGVGPKIAAKWVRAHGDVSGVLARLDTLEPARLRSAVAERAEALRRDEELARLRDDLDLGAGPRAAPFDETAKARLRRELEALELRSLLGRLDDLSSVRGES